MSKGAILDEAFIHAIGQSEQLLTLSAPMENKHHAVLQEALFHINVEELDETIYLDRKYVFDHQISIKASYGKGDRVLVWLQRVLRTNPNSTSREPVDLLMVRELFLLGDWREFQRFKMFVKSMRILDAQSRNWLAEHHGEFAAMSSDSASVARILDHLAAVAEWPDLDGGTTKANSLEQVAKTYGKDLAPVRSSLLLPELLLGYPPDMRFSLFRLLSFVEDPKGGSESLVRFLGELGKTTGDDEVMEATRQPRNSRDLHRAFAAIRTYLLSAKMPSRR
jgi:hypothetical protein